MHYLKFAVILFVFYLSNSLAAQTLFTEDFESGAFPSGWEIQTNATDGGWKVGTNQALSSAYFPIADNGSGFIIGTNDDACNCDKRDERLISPPIDLTGISGAFLSFDAYYTDGGYQGFTEDAFIQVSTDKTNWETLEDLHGHGSWDTHRISLNDYLGESEVYIAFYYSDNQGWLFGFGIDNVSVDVPKNINVDLLSLSSRSFFITAESMAVAGIIANNGAETIESFELVYSVNGVPTVSELFDNIALMPLEFFNFEFQEKWVPPSQGTYTVEVAIQKINGEDPVDAGNLVKSFSLQVYDKVERENKIMEILETNPVISTVATSADQLDRPTDLDFHPVLGRDELWVVNQRTESDGGSTLTISDASNGISNIDFRVDGNAWHFMSLPTAIAFSDDNYNFAVSPGVRDANHSGGTFTGPALFSSDPAIYAQPSGGNGSHLDMLHGSPFSMGIAHEKDNVFWVYDNFNRDIVRYDFVDDHGPGNDDHSDAIVRRYRNIGISGDGDIPNHMILDKETNWLYAVDNGNDRVIRLDIASGSSMTTLALINEPLAEHSEVNGFVWEPVLEELDRPCGIEILDQFMLVGEYDSGEIIVYDMGNNFSELGRIQTGAAGLTGIKAGPDGSIWYTNRIFNELNRIEPGESTSTEDIALSQSISFWPNPVSDILTVEFGEYQDARQKFVSITDLTGKLVYREYNSRSSSRINVSDFVPGQYLLSIQTDEAKAVRKIHINH